MSALTDFTMEPEDMVRKFPNDIPQPQMCQILNISGARTEGGHLYDPSDYTKKQLLDIFLGNLDIIEGFFGINFEEAKKELAEQDQLEEEQLAMMEEELDVDEVIYDDDEPALNKPDIVKEEEFLEAVNQEEMKPEDLGDDFDEEEVEEEIAVIEEMDSLPDIDSRMVLQYQVRYIGSRGRVVHGPTSTFSGASYTFDKDTWVDVEELDFRRKYFVSVRNSIKAKREPHWQVRIITVKQKVIDFFVEGTRKVLRLKPKRLKDVKHLTTDRLKRLYNYEIRSITEFIATPKERLIEILNIDRGTVTEMLDDARRAIQ